MMSSIILVLQFIFKEIYSDTATWQSAVSGISSLRLLEEQRQGCGHGNHGDTAADGHHDGLLHVLIAVLHFEIDIERTHQRNDCSDGIHQLLDGTGITGNLGGSLSNTSRSGILCESLYAAHETNHEKCEGALKATLGLLCHILGRIENKL